MTLSPFAVHRNYRLRHVHVADIKEPVVRALYHHRQAQKVAQDIEFTRDPDARERADMALEDVFYHTKRCNDILADLHKNRTLERGSINPGKVAA